MADVMTTLANLLARAEHPNTPPAERELCFDRANKLMVRHAIDEAELRARQTTAERRAPVQVSWKWLDHAGRWSSDLRTLVAEIARTFRCRAVFPSEMDPEERGEMKYGECILVGFADDVEWTRMLYMSSYYAFLRALFPRWDAAESYDANVYAFKKAGFSWADINREAIAAGAVDGQGRYAESGYDSEGNWHYAGDPNGKYHTLRNAYKREANRRGDTETVLTQRFDAYRSSLAESFFLRLNTRLERLRRQAEEEAGPSNLPALRDIAKDVDDTVFATWPSLHPDAVTERQRKAIARRRELMAEQAREREEMLAAMTPAKRARFLEAEARKERREAESNARYWERVARRYAPDSQGERVGRAAADSVDLTRKSGGVHADVHGAVGR